MIYASLGYLSTTAFLKAFSLSPTYLLLKSTDSDLFQSCLTCLILVNVLNELKFNSTPYTNVEIIDKINGELE